MNEHSIFLAALEIVDPGQRAAYLNQACGDNSELRRQVDSLMAAHERSGDFLNVPALQQIAGPNSGDDSIGGATCDMPRNWQSEISLSFLEPATTVGSIGRLMHYDILQVVGRGGCGIVLKALDTKLHRTVAIKVMAPELATTSPARKRFLREARATAAIRHENVVNIYAVEEHPLPFLVMEFVDGQTLQQKLDQQGPLDLRDVLKIGSQVAAGLESAHAKGLIHRDIKPGNILLDAGSDHAKITDFGLARSADDASMTQSGVISGTPLYMSPEQAQALEIDYRSDLFSLGSVMYVMCSGRPPFRAATSIAVLRRVVEEQPRPVQTIIPEVPHWLTLIIARLHAKYPKERFASAKEVGDLLFHCLSEIERLGRLELPDDFLASIPQIQSAASNHVEQSAQAAKIKTVATKAHQYTLARGRNWVTVAAMLLFLVAGLGVIEATGVSNIRSTMIQLFSPTGTLIVEVDDPGISVTIDGEELIITGAGAKEIRLKPGQYKVLATKDGKLVSQELVTVATNGRQVVRVSRVEATHQNDEPDPTVQGDTLPIPDKSGFTASERKSLEWVLSHDGILKLSVNGVKKDYREGDRLPEQPFRVLELNLHKTISLNKASLENLQALPKVETTVSFGPSTDDEVFAKLASYPGIVNASHIGVWGTSITDNSLVHLAKFPNMAELYLMKNDVSSKGIAHLTGARALGLYLTDCKRIDDEACVVFNSMPILHWLHLDGTSITDAGLAKLTDCKKLSNLRVQRCKVTEAGVRKLAAVLPQCKLDWDGGTIEP